MGYYPTTPSRPKPIANRLKVDFLWPLGDDGVLFSQGAIREAVWWLAAQDNVPVYFQHASGKEGVAGIVDRIKILPDGSGITVMFQILEKAPEAPPLLMALSQGVVPFRSAKVTVTVSASQQVPKPTGGTFGWLKDAVAATVEGFGGTRRPKVKLITKFRIERLFISDAEPKVPLRVEFDYLGSGK